MQLSSFIRITPSSLQIYLMVKRATTTKRGSAPRTIPTVPSHSSISIHQAKNFTGINFDLVSGRDVACTIHIPDDIPTPEPRNELVADLRKLFHAQSFDTEMDRRAIINAIIVDTIYSLPHYLQSRCEVTNTGEAGSKGRTDYMVGSPGTGIAGCLMVVEAKRDWPKNVSWPEKMGVLQLLMGMDAVIYQRKKTGRDTPVFGILSNAENFCFFAMDTDGGCFSSGSVPFLLDITLPFTQTFASDLARIVRWIRFFFNAMPKISPRCRRQRTDVVRTPDDVNYPIKTLAQVRECFGPRTLA